MSKCSPSQHKTTFRPESCILLLEQPLRLYSEGRKQSDVQQQDSVLSLEDHASGSDEQPLQNKRAFTRGLPLEGQTNHGNTLISSERRDPA